MTTITIPQIDKQRRSARLVAISEDRYHKFLEWEKTTKKRPVDDDDRLTPAEWRRLQEARRNFARGEYYLWDDVKRELGLDSRPSGAKRSQAHSQG